MVHIRQNGSPRVKFFVNWIAWICVIDLGGIFGKRVESAGRKIETPVKRNLPNHSTITLKFQKVPQTFSIYKKTNYRNAERPLQHSR